MDELAAKYSGKVSFNYIDINIDENSKLAVTYSIRGIPTFLFFKNSEIVKKFVGLKTKAVLKKHLDELVGST